MSKHQIFVEVNGEEYTREVSARLTLTDFLRDELNLTGTHIGCEHGVCGSCTILFDNQPICSCIMLAVQANGHKIQTVEGMAGQQVVETKKKLTPLQEAFWDCHGLQCGYCTPGMLISAQSLLDENPRPSEQEIREALTGNICRCTGYVQIVSAVKLASERKNGKHAPKQNLVKETNR